MKVVTVLLLVAATLALTGCPENKGSGDAKPGTTAAAATTAKPAGTGGW